MLRTIIIKQDFNKTCTLLRNCFDNLDQTGSLFVLFNTEYDNKTNVVHDFLELIDTAVNIGYEYINTIVYPAPITRKQAFFDNVNYIIWLCKNRSAMVFNKDVIREKHIWKDVEWGKRAKNYNPMGKDPGNVWIPTLDDGKAHITKHILLKESEIVTKLLAMTEGSTNFKIFACDDHSTEIIAQEIEQSKTEFYYNHDKCSATVVFDTAEQMSVVEDSSVRAIITSPPYWNLKDYFKKGQIGQESYPCYLSRMYEVWNECYKKLQSDGSLWININIRTVAGNVILIPYDFVKMCRDIGFYYKGIIVWHKSSGIPTGAKNIVDRHEYVLIAPLSRKSTS